MRFLRAGRGQGERGQPAGADERASGSDQRQRVLDQRRADGFLTPSNIVTSRQTGRGSSRLNPILIDNVAFYQVASVRRSGRSATSSRSTATTATTSRSSRRTCFAASRSSHGPMRPSPCRSSGARRRRKAPRLHLAAGTAGVGLDALRDRRAVESVCSISEGGEDRFTLRHAERSALHRAHGVAFWDTVDDACFVDCAVTYSFRLPFDDAHQPRAS
jgi:hypothetical protein